MLRAPRKGWCVMDHSLLARPALTMLLLLLVAGGPVPLASAHECYAEAGTPGEPSCSKECTDGVAHRHQVVHTHDDGDSHVHYDCKSEAKPPREPRPTPKECFIRVGQLCVYGPDHAGPAALVMA